ncbi:MAG: acyl carrier protein [candidate division Zixibacteria bacterium]|nr:acyl carrier protein [candidate division Zixibacteria bacterium]
MQIEEKVRTFIQDNFLLGDKNRVIKEDESFLQNGIIDSTGVLELVNFIEETYNIKVEDEELVPENLDSIKNLIAYISRKQSAKI